TDEPRTGIRHVVTCLDLCASVGVAAEGAVAATIAIAMSAREWCGTQCPVRRSRHLTADAPTLILSGIGRAPCMLPSSKSEAPTPGLGWGDTDLSAILIEGQNGKRPIEHSGDFQLPYVFSRPGFRRPSDC
ncbi:MAG: hypothetical protein WBG92_24285, partial [Thiohalocapsa sp.]